MPLFGPCWALKAFVLHIRHTRKTITALGSHHALPAAGAELPTSSVSYM